MTTPRVKRPWLRPLAIGLAAAPTRRAQLAYFVSFAAGTMIGMALMSLVLSAPLVVAERRAAGWSRALRGAAGFGSLAVGLLLAWQTGLASRLLP